MSPRCPRPRQRRQLHRPGILFRRRRRRSGGAHLKRLARREDMWSPPKSATHPRRRQRSGHSRKHIITASTLPARWQDYVDVFMLHYFDVNPGRSNMSAMNDMCVPARPLHRVSTCSPASLQKYDGCERKRLGKADQMQLQLNCATAKKRRDDPFCRDQGIGVSVSARWARGLPGEVQSMRNQTTSSPRMYSDQASLTRPLGSRVARARACQCANARRGWPTILASM